MSEQRLAESAQYLTFTLAGELYALDIAKVREVLEFTSVTKVPRTPGFMRGVINLRGNVVPVVDLRVKFGMTRTEKAIDTCVIIAEVEVDGEAAVLGALADAVQEVVELDPGRIEPPPKIGTRLKTTFIRGMGKRDDRFIIILDIDRVFSAEEMNALDSAAGEGGMATEEAVEAV